MSKLYSRAILISLFLLTLLACSTEVKRPSKQATSINSADLKKLVSYLASDELQGRSTGTEGIEKAAQYIENEFKKYNITPYYKNYRDQFDAEGQRAYNLVGIIKGNDVKLKDEFIIISAHYDHLGKIDSNKLDKIANGANDNASGTAAVLALANYFSVSKSNGRSIIFALFSAEELGKLGSQHLATVLKKDDINLYTVINFEMIGVPLENKEHLAYITGYKNSNMASMLNQYTKKNSIGFSPQAEEYNLFESSDNFPFYEIFDIPAHTITSFEFTNYEHYHKTGDEPKELNYLHMALLLNRLKPAINKLTNTATQEIILTK